MTRASFVHAAAGLAMSLAAAAAVAGPQSEGNAELFPKIKEAHGLTDAQMTTLKGIFDASGYMGQGNPKVTQHPMTRQECLDKAKAAGVEFANPQFEKICGGKYLAPLYKEGQKPEDAKACIDQFEFPNIPCEYPVTWTKAEEAAEACSAIGERLCDAHEWEGGCAGSLEEPDYDFASVKGLDDNSAQKKLRAQHNMKYAKTKSWAYGPEFKKGVCGQNSTKANDCNGGNFEKCGTNTYPSGSFPDCKSKLGVYDQHGNAAEHMNLPLAEDQMASRGSKKLGHTEMKGSWFIWDKFQAHEDWCRWRAPDWHGSRVMDSHSHANYHLGFRCCKDVEGAAGKP